MQEEFVTFLKSPNKENFLKLRGVVFAHKNFDPYASTLDHLPDLYDKEDYQEMVNLIGKNLWPNYFLSPDTHLHLGMAHHKLGNNKESEMERMVASALLQGIMSTGDGSEQNPYFVSRTSDEYALISLNDMTAQGQSLVEKNGKSYDIISVEGHDDIWFDITEIRNILKSKMTASQN